MATVLLLRHGRSGANADGVLAGRSPTTLDETGRAQAQALGPRFAGIPLAAVVTSPLPRCRETLALALPEAAAAVDERFNECRYGDWEGRSLAELRDDPLWPVVQHHPSAVQFPGADGESLAEMAARVTAAVRDWDARVTRTHGEHAVWLVCTHGDMIKAVVADALGMHLDLFQRLTVAPASVSVIRYTATRPFVLRVSDTGELPSPPEPEPEQSGSGHDADAAVGGGVGPTGFGKVEV